MSIGEAIAACSLVIAGITFFRSVFQVESELKVYKERLDNHIRVTEKALEHIATKLEELAK